MVASVLFVCTGNICRSPAADAVFGHYARQAQLPIKVDSAGVHSYHVGEAPDHRAIKVVEERGVDIDHLRARKVALTDYYEFDLILGMDQGHVDALIKSRPKDSKAEIALFLDYTMQAPGAEVADPYYGDMRDFEYMYRVIDEACQKLVQKLQLI